LFNFPTAEEAVMFLLINISQERRFKMRNINNEKGRSMIEMLGVLAIIGVLSVGGIAGYSKAMQKYRINKTIEQITLIAGNARTFFGPQRDYRGIYCDCKTQSSSSCRGLDSITNSIPVYENNGCQVVRKAKILPDEMITLDSTGKLITDITSAFGSRVSLFPEYKIYEQGNVDAFVVQFITDNEELCIELLTHNWSVSNVGFIEVDADEDKSAIVLPASVENAVEMCSFSETGYITMYFNVDVNSWKENYNNVGTWY